MDPRQLFKAISRPAPKEDVAALASLYKGEIPQTYLDFLALCNGADSCINDTDGDCLVLWSAKEIGRMNEAYLIPRYIPEFVAVGSNGGDDAVGFDRSGANPEQWPIVRIGFGNLDRTEFVQLANGFADWQAMGFPMKPHAGQTNL